MTLDSITHMRAELAGVRDVLRPYDPQFADRIDQVLGWSDENVREFLMSDELWGRSGSIAAWAGATQPLEVQLRIRDALIRLGESQVAHGYAHPGVVGWVGFMKDWRQAHLRQDDRARFHVPWRPRDVWLGVAAAVLILVAAYALIFVLAASSAKPNLDLWVGLVPTLFELLFLAPVWWFAVRKYRAPLSALGFRNFRPSVLGVGIGLLIAFYFFNLVYTVLLAGFGLDVQTDVTPVVRELSTPWPLFIAVVLVAPVVEETFFRGFVFAGLRSRYDWRLAAGISAVLFAAAHLQITFFIPAFLLGYLFAYLFQRSNSIWPGMIIHALINAFAFTIVLAQAS